MALDCPRCGTSSPEVARFCRHCGLVLERAAGGVLGAGRVPHPEPLTSPENAEPIAWATNLYFQWEAAGGGAPLIGTETLALDVFNAGYDLRGVVLRVFGIDDAEEEVCEMQRELEEWPRGAHLQLEIASYELPNPVRALKVELVTAEFRPTDD